MAVPYRIIDANLNRAREGLRLLEDAARFVLADAAAMRRLKQARHALTSFGRTLPGGSLRLLAHRDTAGDVGTGVKTSGERRRADLGQAVDAAAGRTAEALRVLEECAKLAGEHRAARELERARYGMYEAHGTVGMGLGTGRAPQWRLCVILTESLCARPWLEVARLALAGGADCLQLREKHVEGGELARRARALIRLSRPKGAWVIINDRVDVALAAGADGVHLGQHDLAVREARRLAGDRLLIGVSTHNEREARRAITDGADYAGVGAMFATSTKPRAVSGPDYLRTYLRLTAGTRPLPHLAIGGITPENVPTLTRAGCRGVAVSSAVCGAADPARVCRFLVRALKGGGERRR